jgi:hypothetical protein
MNNTMKTYKIVVDSKVFTNMRGYSPAEVSKKAVSKILGNSLNRTSFSMVEAKTGKIRCYDAKRENLVRPYRKNGKLITSRIVVKKIGKQVGGTYPPDLGENSDDPIFQFFPREEYYFDHGPLINGIQSIEIFSKADLSYQSFCIRFYVIGNVLYLSELNKCHYSGKINLNKIIEYAKSFGNIELIELTDVSKIKLIDIDPLQIRYISLSLLSILSSGKSWYNKYGFFSKDYTNELVENKKKIIMNINDFMKECIEKLVKNSHENKSKLDKQKDKFFTYYKQEKTVQEIFTQIKAELFKFGKNNAELFKFGDDSNESDSDESDSNKYDKLYKEKEKFNEQFKIIFGILSIIEKSKIIIYDSNLTRILEK